jgi:GAF domain-containing protein
LLAARYAALRKLADRDLEQLDAPTPVPPSTPQLHAVELLLTQCHGPRDRAERALQAITEQLGCEGGFLYVMKPAGPELVAQIGAHTPPADLDAHLAAEIEGDLDVAPTVADIATTSDGTPGGWPAPDGASYYPRLLAHPGRTGLEITGLVVLRHSDPQRHRLPPDVSTAISRALREAGDAPTVLAAS